MTLFPGAELSAERGPELEPMMPWIGVFSCPTGASLKTIMGSATIVLLSGSTVVDRLAS